MTRPHEQFHLPLPIGRRLPQGLAPWNALAVAILFFCVGAYIVQVNRAASQGFKLRDVEKQVDTLHVDVTALEDSVAQLSSIQNVSARAQDLGFTSVDRMEFVKPPLQSYALVR